MDQSALMGGLQSPADLVHDLDNAGYRKPLA